MSGATDLGFTPVDSIIQAGFVDIEPKLRFVVKLGNGKRWECQAAAATLLEDGSGLIFPVVLLIPTDHGSLKGLAEFTALVMNLKKKIGESCK